jgi:hypothetical protein
MRVWAADGFWYKFFVNDNRPAEHKPDNRPTRQEKELRYE